MLYSCLPKLESENRAGSLTSSVPAVSLQMVWCGARHSRSSFLRSDSKNGNAKKILSPTIGLS